jgi:hypothetical protein
MVGVGVAAGACRQHALVHGLDSPEAVARAVITALAAHDVEALRKLALTEDEFRGVVWPRLPASRPERNVPWDYAWNDLHAKSSAQLQARVRGWKDRGFDVVRVAFEGETSEYDTFRVRRKSVLTLRDRDGQETRGRLFGSVIEQDGRYKVFSYVVD